ncbi:MAG: phosphoglucosamine mutase [Firmicutes bacterium]|nr:phosphoglucosamine mutase [Bacillota bacterium]
MGKYFGTDGFRGEANVNLTVEHAFKVGRFLGWYYGRDHKAKIVIGKDTRRSSYMFEYSLVAGLTASGADAYLLHVTTTPSVSYVVRTEGFDCGIMISASHNPFYDNGIKVINGMGYKLEAEVEEKIEEYLDGKRGELPLATKENIGRTVDFVAGRNRYIGYLISLATRSFKNYKIGLDCANGSSSAIAKSVFDALGAKTYVMNNEPNGININENCGSTHIGVLQKFVKENGLNVGFAYDGDADRCIAVDENGNVVDGDLILYVCGKYLKEEGKLRNNTIVTTVMSNLGLYKACDKAGISYEKTAVGDKYVYENMMENGHCLGGEQSGHIIFSKHATTGDGILTSLMIMEVLTERKQSLATLTSEVRIYPQLLKNVRVADKKMARENPEVVKAVAAVGEALGEEGRILVRESGTEPVIRVMVEAAEDALCEKYVNQVVDVMKAQGLVTE